MRARTDGSGIRARGRSKGQRVRRRRPRAVAHRGEPADVVVVVERAVCTFLDGCRGPEVAGSNPVVVAAADASFVVVVVAAQLDASKRDPAGGDARSAARGIEPGTTSETSNRRVRRRRALERRRDEDARASHDLPGDESTSHRARDPPVVVILREHGIDESRAAARVLVGLGGGDVLSLAGKVGKVPASARDRTRNLGTPPPISLRRRNRVRDLNLAVPGERVRGDERGGERAGRAGTVRIRTRSRRTVTRSVTPGIRGPVVRVGEEAVDVERGRVALRARSHRRIEEVRPVPADDVSP